MFKDKLTLLHIETGLGTSQNNVTAQTGIFADVKRTWLKTQYNALYAGTRAELQAVVWRHEYESNSFTHADYNGKRYKIETAGRGENDGLVKLILIGVD